MKKNKQSKKSKEHTEDDSEKKKRKKPQSKKSPKPQKKSKKIIKEEISDKNSEKESKNELTFEGISEKDPSFNQAQLNEIEYPYWLKPEFLKDANGRSFKNDPDYDSSTLYIPPEEFQKLSPLFKQYWEIKSKNFDKIVFFRMGAPFFCYYDDAIIMGRITDSKISFWGTRPFTLAFPKNYPFYKEKLISLGYKVVTIEQMENEVNKKDSICKREIVEILTKGTITDENYWNSSEAKFLMCILQKNNKFGICFFDALTQNFFVDELTQIEDLYSIIYRVKPVEIVSVKGYLDMNLIIFIKNVCNPVFSQISHYLPLVEEINTEFKGFFKDRDMPIIILELFQGFQRNKHERKEKADLEEEIPNFYLIQSLFLCYSYLKALLIVDSMFLYGNFFFFDIESMKSQRLYMDSIALSNLEIFDVNFDTKVFSSQSLFNYINKTKTGYGKRLLKKWIESPLRNQNEINDRLDAIEDLNKNCTIADYFHSQISKLPDFERALGRIYNSTNKQKLACSEFDNFASNRLNDFLKLLGEFSKVNEIMETFNEYKDQFRSKRLKKLVTFKKNEKDEKGLFPNIITLKNEIDEMIDYSNEIAVPKPGKDEKYDEISKNIKNVQNKLNEVLMQLRKKMKCSELVYNHNKIRKYEIEIPENLKSKVPPDFSLTSKKKGILRYQNGLIENFVEELEGYETELNKILAPFFLEVFKKFYTKQSIWLQVISCLAELDCLISLSKLITDMEPFSCRPIFSNENVFQLKECFHPCLINLVPNFVTNDIIFSKETCALLITGPNMGGKSTILRQACLSIIMAQMGSYVPAKHFVLKPFDRIFCRIGANDRILERKSTFFTEMEESYTIIKEATEESFVIFDELGRGTSTYDGLALAYSVLKYMVEKIQCKTLFSTHYHLLIDEFKFFPNIKKYFMDFKYNEANEQIDFLYKFIEGEACKSFGINVAKIVGVPKDVLISAKEKALALNNELSNLREIKRDNEKYSEILDFLNKV